jgi:hypothetical protein
VLTHAGKMHDDAAKHEDTKPATKVA